MKPADPYAPITPATLLPDLQRVVVPHPTAPVRIRVEARLARYLPECDSDERLHGPA